jgi:hypothetical protein
MSIFTDAKVGDVIRVFLKHNDDCTIGALVSFDEEKVVLRPQVVVRVHIDDEECEGIIENVTIDSSKYLNSTIDLNDIYAWEPASFASIIENAEPEVLVELDDDRKKQIAKRISRLNFFPHEVHYYDKDGFCLNI